MTGDAGARATKQSIPPNVKPREVQGHKSTLIYCCQLNAPQFGVKPTSFCWRHCFSTCGGLLPIICVALFSSFLSNASVGFV